MYYTILHRVYCIIIFNIIFYNTYYFLNTVPLSSSMLKMSSLMSESQQGQSMFWCLLLPFSVTMTSAPAGLAALGGLWLGQREKLGGGAAGAAASPSNSRCRVLLPGWEGGHRVPGLRSLQTASGGWQRPACLCPPATQPAMTAVGLAPQPAHRPARSLQDFLIQREFRVKTPKMKCQWKAKSQARPQASLQSRCCPGCGARLPHRRVPSSAALPAACLARV